MTPGIEKQNRLEKRGTGKTTAAIFRVILEAMEHRGIYVRYREDSRVFYTRDEAVNIRQWILDLIQHLKLDGFTCNVRDAGNLYEVQLVCTYKVLEWQWNYEMEKAYQRGLMDAKSPLDKTEEL